MGQDDNLSAAIAHILLGCVASHGIQSGQFSRLGMHGNFLVHGVIGFLHYQSNLAGELASLYGISSIATKYLALPCLMADLYSSDKTLSILHLVSGLVPFTLAVTGKDDPHLGHLVVAANTISLLIYSVQHNIEWGYFTAGAACLAYFVKPTSHMIVYPLCLALMEHCAYRIYCRRAQPAQP